MFALVAQINRISMGRVTVEPKRDNSLFSKVVSSRDCMGRERLPISSRKRVPPEAVSRRPAFSLRASVNAPFS